MSELENIEVEAVAPETKDVETDIATQMRQIQLAHSVAIEEIAQLKDQLLRSAADHENFRKRSLKQVEDASKFAVSSFSKDLIDVLENLYLATNNIPAEVLIENEAFKSILQGVEMTKTTLINVFEKYGINRIFPQVGDNFDHNVHQAVAHIEQPDFADNAIVDVMRAGYVLHDRLIKPAMVVVAKNKQS
jgi:molecular chaperone GrpE